MTFCKLIISWFVFHMWSDYILCTGYKCFIRVWCYIGVWITVTLKRLQYSMTTISFQRYFIISINKGSNIFIVFYWGLHRQYTCVIVLLCCVASVSSLVVLFMYLFLVIYACCWLVSYQNKNKNIIIVIYNLPTQQSRGNLYE